MCEKILGNPHIVGHHSAKNWGCPDTVDTNGLMPLLLTIAGIRESRTNLHYIAYLFSTRVDGIIRAAYRRANGSVRWAWSKGRRPSGAVLHSSREPGVRRPCSDFMHMLRCLINCRIIIIIIIIIINIMYRSC